MKVKLILALLFVSTLFSFKADNPIKILFFGDSITQAGIGKTGYITKMAEMLSSKGLSGKYELIGAGIGGTKFMIYTCVMKKMLSLRNLISL
jgi:hypothetical protein